jgi:uncharacterized YigZ family protein
LRTIETIAQNKIEINRSKFIAFILPYDAFEAYYERLKNEHPKANHIVYAYRFLNAYGQIVENSSDDGEPKGCAGVPVLQVMRGEMLVNCAVAVVRYFGGIKLGTGGMARAYGDATKAVVRSADIVPFVLRSRYRFKTPYEDIRQTQYRLKQCRIERFERMFEPDGVVWEMELSDEEKRRLQSFYTLQPLED